MRQPVLRAVQQAVGRSTGRPQAMGLAISARQQQQQQQQQLLLLLQKQFLSRRPFSTVRAQTPSATTTQRPTTATRFYSSAASSPESSSPSSPSPSSSSSAVTIPPLPTVFQHLAAPAAPSHPSLYATVHIHGRPYLVTEGDRLRLPFRMPGVQAGDQLRLDRVGVVGSRELTVKAGPPQETVNAPGTAGVPGVSVSAVVLGLETEPLRVKVKTKRRNRRSRTIRSKHFFTVLRIQEVVLEEPSTA